MLNDILLDVIFESLFIYWQLFILRYKNIIKQEPFLKN